MSAALSGSAGNLRSHDIGKLLLQELLIGSVGYFIKIHG